MQRQNAAMPYAPTVPDTDTELVLPEHLTRDSKRRPLLWTVGIVLVLIVVIVTVYFLRRPAGTTEYRTAPVERRTIVETVEATGHLDVLNRFHVPAPIAGRVVEMFVKPGAEVKAGDPLAQLDARAAAVAVRGSEAALRAAGSRVSEAEAAVSAAQDTLSRVERLAAKGLASPNELAQARAQAAKARAALKAARAEQAVSAQEVTQAELAEGLGTLRAPMDGVVLSVEPVPGAAVSPEAGPLFVIGSSLKKLRLSANVAEADIGNVRVNQPATFRVPAFPGRVFSGRVERVDVEGDQTGTAVTYPVMVEVENPEGSLLPGMTATTVIEVARAKGVLAVREAALRLSPAGAEPAPARSRVFIPRETGIEPVAVAPGISDGSYTEVRPEPGHLLHVGDPVAIGIALPENGDTSRPGISLGRRQ